MAKNDLTLQSATQADSSRRKNSALGWNVGIATATLSPSVAKQIGQYFKAQGRQEAQGGPSEGSAPHLIAHGLLAGAVAVAGGNNALSAAASAMTAEAAAPLLAHYLYGKEANTLTADEKTTISAITGLVGAGDGASTGNHTNIAQGAQSGQNAVGNNQLSTFDIGPIFGVDKWGSGAASLINSGIEEGKSIEEINEALIAYNRGDGFDNGMTDGLMMWAIAPSAAFAGGATISVAGTPVVINGAKTYMVLASKSVAGGIGTSMLLDDNYKVFNLVYDLSFGVLIDKSVLKLMEKSGAEKLIKNYLDIKGKTVNHFLGGGISSALPELLDVQDPVIVDKLNWSKEMRGKND